jgi:hypothetical protein
MKAKLMKWSWRCFISLLFTERGFVGAWKRHDWDALSRLHESGLIGDPKNKNKSVGLSKKGASLSEELFWKFFGNLLRTLRRLAKSGHRYCTGLKPRCE